jgi:hypothetical protein
MPAHDLAEDTPDALVDPPRRGLPRRLAGRLPVLLPARLRPLGRPNLLLDVVLIAVSYGLYTLIRDVEPAQHTAPIHRAHDILSLEETLHINIEHALNHGINHVTWLIVLMNYYYATLHFVITIGVLLWVYFRHPQVYRSVRTVLGATTWLALVGFYFYALAPPRLAFAPGYFLDTGVLHHTWGATSNSGGMNAVSNQYAAMPSMHIGWSTWCALTIFMLTENRWVRWGSLLYPVFTFTVILATANHFVIDAVAGLITLAAGFGLQRVLQGRPAYRPPVLSEPATSAATLITATSPDGVPPQRSGG